MLRFKFISQILLYLIFATNCYSENQDFYLGGIQVNEPDSEVWINTLKQQKFNTVAVTVYAHQGSWNSDNLFYDQEAPSVINEIRVAKAAGFKVVMIMRVALDHTFKHNEDLWHGMILPTTQLDTWFNRYTKFVSKWAKVAEAEGVDIFGIGSEMRALSMTKKVTELPMVQAWHLDQNKQNQRISKFKELGSKNVSQMIEASKSHRAWAEEVSFDQNLPKINLLRSRLLTNWKKLIKATRSVYHGKLTYAANFDEYHDIAFWQDLDVLGINAYFPLRSHINSQEQSSQQMLEEMKNSWQNIFQKINYEFKSIKKMPVLFTEIGYTRKQEATVLSWSGFGEELAGDRLIKWDQQKTTPEERVLAMQALRAASEDSPVNLLGLLYWKLSTIKDHWEIEPFVHVVADPKDQQFTKALTDFLK